MLLLNPQKINDRKDEEDDVCQPRGEERIDVAVVAEYLTCFHERKIDECHRNADAEINGEAASSFDRGEGDSKQNNDHAGKRKRDLVVKVDKPS